MSTKNNQTGRKNLKLCQTSTIYLSLLLVVIKYSVLFAWFLKGRTLNVGTTSYKIWICIIKKKCETKASGLDLLLAWDICTETCRHTKTREKDTNKCEAQYCWEVTKFRHSKEIWSITMAWSSSTSGLEDQDTTTFLLSHHRTILKLTMWWFQQSYFEAI